MTTAQRIVDRCTERGWTIATAESITAGGIAAALASVPGCSRVLRGGIVAYDSQVKVSVLGVGEELVAHVVSSPVADAMAVGARHLLRSDIAIATTGVAGPDELDDQPPGTVWCAVVLPAGEVHHVRWQLPGDRGDVQGAAVAHALEWLETLLPT